MLALLCLAAAALVPVSIRPAVLTSVSDAEAICKVRAPTTYVSEDGSTGFMGVKVDLSPEEAHSRRVEARLGTAIRDGADVLIAVPDDGPLAVVGTIDCLTLSAGKGRRAMAPELPKRLLVRNLWVTEELRRQGIARRLVGEAEALARAAGIGLVSLEVVAENKAALALYASMGYEDLDPPTINLPLWMRGALLLGKDVSASE